MGDKYDALNVALRKAEQKLRDVKPTMTLKNDIRVKLNSNGVEYIGFKNFENQSLWRLVYIVHHNYDDMGFTKILTDCSPDVKIRAVKALPFLYAEIVKAKEESVDEVDLAIQTLNEFLNELKDR